MVNYDTIKLGLIVGITVFIYMLLASVSNYLPPSLAIGLLVSYIYNMKTGNKHVKETPVTEKILIEGGNKNELQEIHSSTSLPTCPFAI